MYNRILVPLDGSYRSEQVLPYVRQLGLELSIPLTLVLVVVPPPSSISRDLNPDLYQHETVEHQTEHAGSYLGAVAEGLRSEGLSVSTVIPCGVPWQAIVEEARQTPDTLIAMSGHGRSGVARWWLGSVADRVLHLTTGPLLLVKSHQDKEPPHGEEFNRVIVPVDGSPLAEAVLPHVTLISKGLDLAVHLVRVIPTHEHLRLAVPPDLFSGVSADSALKRETEEAAEYLEGLKERLLNQGVGPVDVHLLHGDPASSIIDIGSETRDRLVAMTTHGRSGVGRWILGSVADRIIRYSGDPVLLVRAAESTTSKG